MRIDDVFEPAGAVYQNVGARGRKRHLPVSNRAQVVLEMVGQLLCGPQLDHRRNGFERMEIPEEVVQAAR